MSIDSSAKFAKSHEYVKLENGEAVIGISDHAQAELGDIVFVELPPVGKSLSKGQTFGTVESVKAASDLYMPISGVIVGVNGDLQGDPALVNKEPYAGGWMVRVKPSDPSEMDALLDAKAYAASVGEE